MGRAPCCAKVGLHRGPWTPREDTLLTNYIQAHGEGHWKYLPQKAGLLRCGKSCRLRWMNYLRPDIKRGNICPDEDDLIIRLHSLLGNRWSLIAGRLPGRTDNEIKNYWNTHLRKRLRSQGTDPNTHKQFSDPVQDPKKRKNTSKKKKHHIKNMQKPNLEMTEMKPKIHLPKPTRFTTSFSLPRIDSFECNTLSGSSSHACPGDRDHDHAGGGGIDDTEGAGNVPCSTTYKDTSENNGVDQLFFVSGGGDDEDHDLFNGSDFECQSHIPTADNTLDKLYEEYLQLLRTEEADQVQLDDFAESLFI